MSLEQNFITVCQQIRKAEELSRYQHLHKGQVASQPKVRLLAVSKKKPASMIEVLWCAGQRDFGENYVQEALEKIAVLKDLEGICWHLIGPLQSNKTREVASAFDWVHTIDRIKIAERLSNQRPLDKSPLNVCIQINISHQISKSGVREEDIFTLAEAITILPGLKLRGLMTIPATTDFSRADEVFALRTAFKKMYQLYTVLKLRFPDQLIDTLSMGMSRDMLLAIEEGSNLVRVGTALFGERR